MASCPPLPTSVALCAALLVTLPAGASEDSAAVYVAPELAVGAEHAWISNIPLGVRVVHAYERPEDGAQLPARMRVLFGVPSLGLSLVAPPLGMELTAMLSSREAGDGARRTLEEIATGGDDYVGYVIHSESLDVMLRRRAFQGFWVGAGWRFEFGRLESGADAYSSFHRQQSLDLPAAFLGAVSIGHFAPEGSLGVLGFIDVGVSVSPAKESRVISLYVMFRGGLMVAPWHEDRTPP